MTNPTPTLGLDMDLEPGPKGPLKKKRRKNYYVTKPGKRIFVTNVGSTTTVFLRPSTKPKAALP